MTKNLVVIFVEGLGSSLVGAYGANTAQTPSMDRLAARGLVLDNCFLDSLCLETQLRSLWTGQHAMQSDQDREGEWTIWSQLTAANVEACLITDCADVASEGERRGCPEVMYVEPLKNATPCEDNSQCSLSGVFAAAAEELESGREGLVWVHSRGLRLPWDAPVELRCRFADPGDPDPPLDVEPPQIESTVDADPDIVTGWAQVAAAQVAVVDQAIAALRNIVSARQEDATFSWVIGSLGGVSLGENDYVGFGNPTPHSEQLRIVAILCPASWCSTGKRHAELFQLPDLCPSMLELLGEETPSSSQLWGDSCFGMPLVYCPEQWPQQNKLAALSTATWQWVRCPAWSAVLEAGQTVRLFVKPDDRWEVADVANRRLEVSERIQECYEQFRKAVEQQQRNALPVLADELTDLLR